MVVYESQMECLIYYRFLYSEKNSNLCHTLVCNQIYYSNKVLCDTLAIYSYQVKDDIYRRRSTTQIELQSTSIV